MKEKKKKRPSERKPRFCDPGACANCQYIGEGDFLCDEHQEIVVSDWEPTEHYMMCRKKKVRVNNGRK